MRGAPNVTRELAPSLHTIYCRNVIVMTVEVGHSWIGKTNGMPDSLDYRC